MDIDQAITDLGNANAMVKITRILDKDDDLKTKFEVVQKSMIERAEAQMGGKMPETEVDCLLVYKKAVGDEMFAAVANNPNLAQMARKHMSELAKQVVLLLVDEVYDLFIETGHTEVTKTEITAAFDGMISVLQR